MASMVVVSPASGDEEAVVYASSTSTTVISRISKGTTLKVNSTSNGYHEINLSPDTPLNKGGDSMKAIIAAMPKAYCYDNENKKNIVAEFNNGTSVEILDDTTSPTLFKVIGVSTQGTIETWVERKLVIRENTEPYASTRQTRGIVNFEGTALLNPTVIYENASTTSPVKGTVFLGTTDNIVYSLNGFYTFKGGWVLASHVSISGTNTSGVISTSDTYTLSPVLTPEPTRTSFDYAVETTINSIISPEIQSNFNEEYYTRLYEKYMYSLGVPPKYNMDVDVQYANTIFPGAGRVYQKTVLSHANYLSLCPGRVVMFPDIVGDEKVELASALMAAAESIDFIDDDVGGRLYAFKDDSENFATHLNILCRTVSILLGIGNDLLADTTTKHALFDYSAWAVRKKFKGGADDGNGIYSSFWDKGILAGIGTLAEQALTDAAYINFFLNGSETNISESISNELSESPIMGLIDGASNIGATINYFTGSGFDMNIDEASAYLNHAFGGNDVVDTLAGAVSGILKGGRMSLPKMLSGATFGRGASFAMKFMSPYGDPKSVFYKCLVPICHLLALALPKQIGDGIYTYPYIVRGGQPGGIQYDMAVITDISITKGGAENSSFSVNNLATEWDVSIELTPLIDELSISSGLDPFLFIKNAPLIDYLSCMCGFDINAPNLDTMTALLESTVKGFFIDIPMQLENIATDGISNLIGDIFGFTGLRL